MSAEIRLECHLLDGDRSVWRADDAELAVVELDVVDAGFE